MPMRELMGATVDLGKAGFVVEEPTVDTPLPGGEGHLRADPERAILRVAHVGTFAIWRGELIRVDPEPDVAPGALSMWLHGSVAALLLAQRGRFALHAGVVQIGRVGVAVAGPRGAGKSTTALRLAQRGHVLVTDDVSPLDDAGPVTTHSFARPLHVFSQTADTLGIDVSDAEPIVPEHPKLALPTAASPPVRLGAIVVLEVRETADVGGPRRMHGAQAQWLVAANLYRTDLLGDLYRTEMFDWAGSVAAKVPVHVATRPLLGWTVDLVADAVEQVAAEHAP